jgi:cytidylate kinase
MDEVIQKQVEKWEKAKTNRRKVDQDHGLSVITLSSQAGSNGALIANGVAERLQFDYFNKKLIEIIAESAHIGAKLVESVEKKRLSGIDDFMASFVDKEHLIPELYLKHLMKVVSAIATHGRAVIVGRGCNFILPPELRFSIRTIAPEKRRIQNIARSFNVTRKEAKARVLQRESKRSAFVKRSYHKEINDHEHYDLVINTGRISIDTAVNGICAYFECLRVNESRADSPERKAGS